jgi:dTDP-4-amino-4,6-dideoxygalactose transaminase
MIDLLPPEYHEYSISDALRGLIAGFQPRKERDALSLPGIGETVPVRSARAAIIVALKALDLEAGARVGVPLYCCPVVFKAVRAAGYLPRFIDVDPETYCLSPEDLAGQRDEIDVLLAVHMFGHLCDMPGILDLMKGKPVIEDCAQSIGSLLNGRASGTFGDISFFSFRAGKYLSAGEGGALYAARPDVRDRIEGLIRAMPAANRSAEAKHVCLTYVRSKLRSRPWWGLLGSKVWAAYNRRTEFAEKAPIRLGRIFLSDMAVASRRALRLESMVKKQRAHAAHLFRSLNLEPRMLISEKPGTEYNRFQFPIRFRTAAERDKMAGYLLSKGIGVATPYEDAAEGAARHYGYQGDCPVSETLLKRTLAFPIYYGLTEQNLDFIVSCLNQGWQQSLYSI